MVTPNRWVFKKTYMKETWSYCCLLAPKRVTFLQVFQLDAHKASNLLWLHVASILHLSSWCVGSFGPRREWRGGVEHGGVGLCMLHWCVRGPGTELSHKMVVACTVMRLLINFQKVLTRHPQLLFLLFSATSPSNVPCDRAGQDSGRRAPCSGRVCNFTRNLNK